MFGYHRIIVGSLILSATVSCGRARTNDTAPDTGPIVIVFHNESLDQADVFAVRQASGALRLGTVMAGHTDTLTIQRGTIPPGATVDFVARLLSRSRTPHSGPVAVQPGQRLSVTLPTTENILAVLPGQ
jgi:hypothetical protein